MFQMTSIEVFILMNTLRAERVPGRAEDLRPSPLVTLCSESSISSGPSWDLRCRPQTAMMSWVLDSTTVWLFPSLVIQQGRTHSISPVKGKSKGANTPLALPHFHLTLSYSLINLLQITDSFASRVQWNTVKKQAIAHVETEFSWGTGQRPQNEVPEEK